MPLIHFQAVSLKHYSFFTFLVYSLQVITTTLSQNIFPQRFARLVISQSTTQTCLFARYSALHDRETSLIPFYFLIELHKIKFTWLSWNFNSVYLNFLIKPKLQNLSLSSAYHSCTRLVSISASRIQLLKPFHEIHCVFIGNFTYIVWSIY